MAKRPITERVKEFRENKPKNAKLTLEDMNEIMELGSKFEIITTAFYFGYMRGMKSKKGGAA